MGIVSNRKWAFLKLIKDKERLENRPCADPFLIAKAKSNNYCVVTEESKIPSRIRIPSACKAFGVECCNLKDLLDRQGWKF